MVAGYISLADHQAHYLVYDLTPGAPIEPRLVTFDAVLECTALGAQEAITGTNQGELLVWLLSDGKVLRSVCAYEEQMPAHAGAIKAMFWSKDARYLVSGGSDHIVRFWDMENERLLHSLEGHTDDVRMMQMISFFCSLTHNINCALHGL